MKIFVCGGSNSLRHGNWSEDLARQVPDPVVNLSIGASSTMMALMQGFLRSDIGQGDVLIWEYALNEMNYIDQRDYDPEMLLTFVEYLIRHCARREIALVPLVLMPRARYFAGTVDAYLKGLRRLFSHYSVSKVEAARVLEEAFGDEHLLQHLYADPNHFVTYSPYTATIAEQMAAQIARARPPRWRAPIRPDATRRLVLRSEFTEGTRENFRNSLISLDVCRPAPILSFTAPIDGELIALPVLATPRGGGVVMTVGARRHRLSLTHSEPDFDRPLFKIIYLPRLFKRPLSMRKGDDVRFQWAHVPGQYPGDFGFRETLPEALMGPGDGAIGGGIFRAAT